MEPEALALTLPIRRLVEFLLRTGSIDSRFTGFDRALEGARLHRKLQRAAVKEYPNYQAEAALKQDYACAQITYTLEGRADGIFTDTDGMPTIDEIKTTTLPPELITGEQSPEHWAQAQIYAAIYARQNGLSAMRVRLTYFQVDEELEFRFSHDYSRHPRRPARRQEHRVQRMASMQSCITASLLYNCKKSVTTAK